LIVRNYPNTPPTAKPLIIFVHGCCDGAGDSFRGLPQIFSAYGYPVYVIDNPYGYAEFWPGGMTITPVTGIDPVLGYDKRLLPTDKPIWFSAQNLSAMITDAKGWANKGNNDKVILIAHSKGGLVSRVYLESYLNRGDISRVIMLGTPNAGSVWPPLPWPHPWWVELHELTFKAMAEFNTQYAQRAPHVDYHLIAGSVPPGLNPLIRSDSDLVVPVFSVHSLLGNNVNYYTLSNTQHFYNADFPYPDYMTVEVFNNCLKPLVESGQAGGCTRISTWALDTRLSSLQFSQPSQVGNFVGGISSGETLSQTVQIDSSGSSVFDLFWDQGGFVA